jgi:hypothetical protein
VRAVNSWLAIAVIGACLVMAAWATLTAVRNRPVGPAHLIGVAAVELLLVAQLVVGVVAVLQGHRPSSTATFVAYLVASLAVVPLATLWSLAERSRPSVLVLTLGFLAQIAMTGRLLQMWSTHG